MALRGYDILYFSNDWNADNRTSSHHIARQLAKSNRILYVESSGLRTPSASAHDLGRVFAKVGAFCRGPRKVMDNVHVLSPILLPFHGFAAIRFLNKWILILTLRFWMFRLGITSPVAWFIIPHMVVTLGHLKERLSVYYCVDDFSSLPGVDVARISSYDRELTTKADVVFTPSKPLFEKKILLNRQSHLSPHGVDFEHFASVTKSSLETPAAMRAFRGPIVGFFGLIEHWIDLALVEHIARRKPEWQIVMIGRVVKNIAAFDGVTNVHFLGPVPYAFLPNYAQCFSAAIIPYVHNAQVFNANPIKLREYLAMGKPVISVKTPETSLFADVIYLADDYDEFVSHIDKAIREDSREKAMARMERVAQLSWENRFEEISNVLFAAMRDKGKFFKP